MKMDKLAGRLTAIANVLARVKFTLGSNLDEFAFLVHRQNHSLVFIHSNVVVKVGNFKLVNAKEWMEREDPKYPALIGRDRSYFYTADVSWSVGKVKGRGSGALGYFLHRERILIGLPVYDRWRAVIDSLLSQVEKTASSLFFNELLEPYKSRPEPTHPEDVRGGRQKEF
jgi:hypothetical protein